MNTTMRPLLILLAVMCAAYTGIAQPAEGSINRFHNYVSYALQQQSNRAVAKNTGVVKQRLIASSQYYGMIRDSVHYDYNNNRGSSYDFNAMTYHDHYFCDFNFAYPYTFTTIGVMCDTFTKWHYDFFSTVPVLDSMATFAYNANDDIIRYTCDDYQYQPPVWHYGNENFFDAQGRLAKSKYRYLDNFTLHDSDFSNFYYDAQNHLVADSAYAYNNGITWLYMIQHFTYLPGGQLYQRHYELINKTYYWYTHEYYSTGQLKSILQEDSYGMLTKTKDSFVYDASGQIVQAIYERIKFAQDPWMNYQFWEKHIDAISGLPDTMYSGSYDLATHNIKDTESKIAYIYNSFGNPVEMYYVLGSSGGYYNTQYYYYDEYTEGIKEQPNTSDIQIYPNPAKDYITITSTQLLNKKLNIQLYNTLGQLLKNEQLVWSNNNYQLSLDGFGNGMYWLVIKDETGLALCGKTVLKL